MISDAWKLGVSSGTLEFIPAPVKGVDRTLTQVYSMQQSRSGADTKHLVAYKRTWSLAFDYLTDTEYHILLKYWDGTKGLGPFVLLDPNDGGAQYTVNLLGLVETVPLKGDHACTLTMQETNNA